MKEQRPAEQVVERISVIRKTVDDCMRHSVRNACTWGHEADIKFLLEQLDERDARIAAMVRGGL